mmetsp:Transcript_51603/g.76478  ORF Transcript_51603/g.76478 Transcript_51603/m.76478 type:complete len:108 (+) Transcript_51603:420-743(+)
MHTLFILSTCRDENAGMTLFLAWLHLHPSLLKIEGPKMPGRYTPQGFVDAGSNSISLAALASPTATTIGRPGRGRRIRNTYPTRRALRRNNQGESLLVIELMVWRMP